MKQSNKGKSTFTLYLLDRYFFPKQLTCFPYIRSNLGFSVLLKDKPTVRVDKRRPGSNHQPYDYWLFKHFSTSIQTAMKRLKYMDTFILTPRCV